MYAVIKKDHLADDILPTREGLKFGDYLDSNNIVDFRALDDDRIVYYEGEGDDEGLEAVFEWAMRDAGVTIIQIKDTLTGTWQDYMS